LGIKGKVTWFINNDYGWTTTYKKQLLEIKERSEEIGLHIHKINEDVRKGNLSSVEELTRLFRKHKLDIEKVVEFRILSFRSGAHAWTPEMFVALNNIGIMYDSSIIPGKVIMVDKELYPESLEDTYNDNRFICKKEFYIGRVLERCNSKLRYFHPTDLVREDGSYNIKNIIKFGTLITFFKLFGLCFVSEPKNFRDMWGYHYYNPHGI
jgi:hypothetical protein